MPICLQMVRKHRKTTNSQRCLLYMRQPKEKVPPAPCCYCSSSRPWTRNVAIRISSEVTRTASVAPTAADPTILAGCARYSLAGEDTKEREQCFCGQTSSLRTRFNPRYYCTSTQLHSCQSLSSSPSLRSLSQGFQECSSSPPA